MDIGTQQRIIRIEPEPLTRPVETPQNPTPEPDLVPDRQREEVPAGA